MSRQSIIDNSRVMIGRNEYSMELDQRVCALTPYKDGKYYSDCSSFVSACFMAGGYDVGWNNTKSFCTNDLFHSVSIVQSGQYIINADKVLKPADVVIWPGHCCIIHRIEESVVYVMDHGDDNPRILALSSVCSWNYGDIVVRRLRELDGEDTVDEVVDDSEDTDQGSLYKVQTGAFSSQESAQSLTEELGIYGFDSWVFLKDNMYTVQCGAFKDQINASELADKLRSKGFDAYIYETK